VPWWSEQISGLFLLPLNIISWPVLTEVHKNSGVPLALRRIVIGIVVATAIMPLLAIFDIL